MWTVGKWLTVIIAIEGLDASGKATQTKLLVEQLRSKGHQAKRFEFPNYESVTGKVLRANLMKQWVVHEQGYPDGPNDLNHKQLSELVFQSIMTVDKYAMAPTLSAFINAKTDHAVLDRYSVSAMAYGNAGGLPSDWLADVHVCLPQPDLWFYIDVPLEESVKRRPERRDRIESDLDYLQEVRKNYLSLFHNEKAADNQLWNIIPGQGTIEEVRLRIWDVVSAKLKL